MSSNAREILAALGGPQNVKAVEPCITRLRVEVSEPASVDEQGLRDAGAFGVVLQGFVIQVVIGPDADELYKEILALMA